jgi:hypothetical protein
MRSGRDECAAATVVATWNSRGTPDYDFDFHKQMLDNTF